MPLAAYGATFVLEGARWARSVPAAEFFVLPDKDPTRENVLEPGEILLAIRLPALAGWRSTYLEARERAAFDWPLVSVAAACRVEGGSIVAARVVLGQVAPVPWRSIAAERALVGRSLGEEAARAAGRAATEGAEPMSQNGYKVELVETLVRRAVASLSGTSS